MIPVIRSADTVPNLNKPGSRGWIEVADQIVGFFDDGVDLVAHAKVYCEPRSHTPVILKEDPVPLVAHVSRKVPGEEARVRIVLRDSLEKIPQVMELSGTLRVSGHVVRACIPQNFSAELEGLLAIQLRNMFREM